MNHTRLRRFHAVLLIAVSLGPAAWSASAAEADEPSITSVKLFINNHRYGETNGCRMTLTPKGQLICGHPGHVSDVQWTFLRTTSEGDIYQFSRTYPASTDSPKTEKKDVVYAGKQVILWHDDVQKILLFPVPTK